MVEPTTLEKRLLTRRLDAGHLERVQHRVRTHLDEGVANAFLLHIERHPCLEDALVKGDQPVHVGGDERQVMDVVEQLQLRLL
jgi:hypothetical protein